MFYKEDATTGEWMVGSVVDFPDGSRIDIDNKEIRDGFEWSKSPPQKYLDWLDSLNPDPAENLKIAIKKHNRISIKNYG